MDPEKLEEAKIRRREEGLAIRDLDRLYGATIRKEVMRTAPRLSKGRSYKVPAIDSEKLKEATARRREEGLTTRDLARFYGHRIKEEVLKITPRLSKGGPDVAINAEEITAEIAQARMTGTAMYELQRQFPGYRDLIVKVCKEYPMDKRGRLIKPQTSSAEPQPDRFVPN